MSNPSFTFKEDTHEYFLDSKRIPSVSEIVGILNDFSKINPERLRAAAEFSKAVHKMIELEEYSDLDETTLDPLLFSYLSAWQDFKKEYKWVTLAAEEKTYHPVLKYAGRLDLIGSIGGRPAIADIKSNIYPSTPIQLIGYSKMMGEVKYRFGIATESNFKLVPFTNDSRDWAIFQSCLNIWNYKNNGGK